MFYGDGIIREEDLPQELELSPHIRERSQGFFFTVKLFGKSYYVPISLEFRRLFGIHIVQGKPNINYTTGIKIEKVLSDIIGSVYLQIRDTVGAEIESHLNQRMIEAFTTMFDKSIELSVVKEMDKRLPAPEKIN